MKNQRGRGRKGKRKTTRKEIHSACYHPVVCCHLEFVGAASEFFCLLALGKGQYLQWYCLFQLQVKCGNRQRAFCTSVLHVQHPYNHPQRGKKSPPKRAKVDEKEKEENFVPCCSI
eukprot:504229-Ditylum_brightwellii.AAC.1